MPGAECWTNHRLILSKMKLTVQAKRRPQGQCTAKKLKVSGLKDATTCTTFQDKLASALHSCQPTTDPNQVEEAWTSFRDCVYGTSLEVLGQSTRRNQDWFDENDIEIQQLLEEKNAAHRELMQAPNSCQKKKSFLSIKKKVQIKLRHMQDSWLSMKADELQSFADQHNYKAFYNSLKAIYGPTPASCSPVLSTDGSSVLREKKDILERRAEHFNSVLNRPSNISAQVIAHMPQVDPNSSLDDTPNVAEVEKAIKQLSDGKAPGADSIPAEIFKNAGPAPTQKLTELFQQMWATGVLPQDFKDATIIHLYKRKGNRLACDNHRGISLLCIAGKILARVLLNRLIDHLENGILPESQCGFRKGRGTTDMIFANRQIQEKCQEQNRPLYTTYVDLTKAFDTVSREGLWTIMSKYGCPPKFTNMVRQFHDGMLARVRDDNETSDAFEVTNGVKQGCVLAPTLFSLVFTAMLSYAYSTADDDLLLRTRTDGGAFNLRRLQAKTKVTICPVRELLFADDCALVASSEEKMQESLDHFSVACDNFGLTISAKKTEVLHQPAPHQEYTEPHIKVNDTQLSNTEKFTYLGSTISRSVSIDEEVDLRISKASSAFGRLREKVWDRRGITSKTKIKVYRAVVLTSLLYGCESWTVYERHSKKLNRFHLNSLRKILKIRWWDKVPDTEVLEKANLPSIPTLLKKAQLRWAGHVTRMPDSRLPKQLFYGELVEGKRLRGGPKKRFKDSLKATLKEFNINPDHWEAEAQDRSAWRTRIAQGASSYEDRRIANAKRKREERKSRSLQPPAPDTDHVCQVCHKTFKAAIGLFSHKRTHQI